MRLINDISGLVVDECIRIHRELGPGLLKLPVDINYYGMCIPGAFRMDLLIEGQLIVEIKSVESLSNLHAKQLLTYPRLTDRRVGLLLNFSSETMKEGIRRVVNNHPG